MTTDQAGAGSGDAHDAEAADLQALKERFIAKRGYWNRLWDQLLVEDRRFFEAYMEFSIAPTVDAALDEKTRELIFIAIDACTTHLFEPGIRIHMRNALSVGATKREILEVLELVSVVGIHSVAVGLPLLLDEVDRAHERGASE
jgi:alkylhydroperoxidase/carboxymuconolactone decarboxylase family protein YurZ